MKQNENTEENKRFSQMKNILEKASRKRWGFLLRTRKRTTCIQASDKIKTWARPEYKWLAPKRVMPRIKTEQIETVLNLELNSTHSLWITVRCSRYFLTQADISDSFKTGDAAFRKRSWAKYEFVFSENRKGTVYVCNYDAVELNSQKNVLQWLPL